MRESGFYGDVSEADYHADRESLSQSGAKILLRSPAEFAWGIEHPAEPSAAMRLGSALHSELLGVGPAVAIIPPTGHKKVEQEAHKQAKAEAEKRGYIAVSPDEHERVVGMVKSLRDHPQAAALLADGEAEVSAYAPDPETGVMRRARFDLLREDLGVDVKTATSSHPIDFARAVASFGYHQQHAWYVDVAYDLGHDLRGFVFVVVTSTEPYAVRTYELVPSAVDVGRERNRRALDTYQRCTETGDWSDPTDITPIDIPRWAYYQNQETA